MSDRTIAALLMLVPTLFSWWLTRSYLRAGEIYSGRTHNGVTRATSSTRFWAGVVLTALPGCFTFGLAVICLLLP